MQNANSHPCDVPARLALIHAALSSVRECRSMIEITDRETADTWPTLRRTDIGAFLLDYSLPELALAENELLESLQRMNAGECLECGDLGLLVGSAESVVDTTRHLLTFAEAQMREG